MADNKNLYAFEKLCRYLHIPSKCNIWQEITKELTIEEQLNNIEFTKEGVLYTDSKGNKWLGYVYKKYKALGNGGKDNYPRMHLCHCGVTETWGKAPNVLLVDYQYYTLKTVEKWQNRFCVDTKNVRFNVFNFWLHQNYIDMDWMVAFEPTP